MKHNTIIFLTASLFAAFMFVFLTGVPGRADEVANEEQDVNSIRDASKEMESLEGKRADLNDRLSKIKSYKKDVLVYIKELDSELKTLNKDLEELSIDIETASSEYEDIVKELREIESEKKNQYDTMKTRIKYMYENGNQEYLELLLSSGSFGELMNRTEYISKITQYDSELFDTYLKLEESAVLKRDAKDKKLKELKALKAYKEYEQRSLEALKEDKNKELLSYKEQIGKTKEEVEKYNKEIEEQERLIEELLEEERRKIEAEQKRLEKERRKEEKKNDNTEDGSEDSGNGYDNGSGSELFRWPLDTGGVITGNFGYREVPIKGASSYHNGLDIGVPEGTPILAAASGTVVISRYSSTAGNYVMIYHGGSTYTVYMHASELAVKEGDVVYKGQVIAYVGTTGLSTGPHLHFGVNVGNEYVDPLGYVTQP